MEPLNDLVLRACQRIRNNHRYFFIARTPGQSVTKGPSCIFRGSRILRNRYPQHDAPARPPDLDAGLPRHGGLVKLAAVASS